MRYQDIVGQAQIKERLKQLVLEDRVPHALLFAGPEGTGKLPMAFAFASALLCENPHEGEACGVCQSCRFTARLEHPDLHFVFPVVKDGSKPAISDAKLELRQLMLQNPYAGYHDWLATISDEKKKARIYVAESEQILHKLSIVSAMGRYKVMIIWLPENMEIETANALLKTLEEPTGQTAFILVSNDAAQLLETIRSRTQRFNFSPLGEAVIVQALQQQRGLSVEDARVVARQSNGSLSKAYQELAVGSSRGVNLELFQYLMRRAYGSDVVALETWASRMSEQGREKQKEFLAYCLEQVRENFMYNFQRPELNYESAAEAHFSSRFARFVNERNVKLLIEAFTTAYRDIDGNVNARMVFFNLALRTGYLIKQGK